MTNEWGRVERLGGCAEKMGVRDSASWARSGSRRSEMRCVTGLVLGIWLMRASAVLRLRCAAL